MLYAPLSYSNRSKDMPLAVNAVLSADGQALVGSMVNGVYGVGPSTGAAGETFVGFLMAQTSAVPFLPTTQVKVETLTANGSGVVTIGATPIAGTVGLFDVTDGVPGTPVVSGNTVTDAATAGHVVRVTYAVALTVMQAQSIAGSGQPGGYSGNIIGSVAVNQQGVVYTDQFDTTVDWAAATAVKLGANGKLVGAGTGATLNAKVIALPTTDVPYLGLQFDSI